MEIYAHRGLWKKENEKNKIKSIVLVMESDFNVEIDIRDFNGNVYISHDSIYFQKTSLSKLIKILKKRNLKKNELILWII